MKILVVDDSVFSQKTTIKTLKTIYPNALYETANDGIEGIKAFETVQPDIVFMDLLMPNMNGQDSIVHILNNNPKAKIIVLSADVQSTVRDEVLESGALLFINKPINVDKLKEIELLMER